MSASSSEKRNAIICVVGARPNLMKIAPIMSALRDASLPVPLLLLHTGQHYDAAMNDRHFAALGIPNPDVNLEVGSASHAVQTAEIMRRFEPVVKDVQPTAVLVVGDVNSTIACALVAAKLSTPVIHVEAGLRSYDRTMPEEINRLLTDQISDLLFTTEEAGKTNLLREGISPDRIHFVGNVMIDTLLRSVQHATPPIDTLRRADIPTHYVETPYVVLTLHRPSNVDDPQALTQILVAIASIGKRLPIVFPIHPRTRSKVREFGLEHLLKSDHVALLPPVDYLEMLGLIKGAKVVLTDSGGLQEETTALGIPCITLRNNTERPVTLEQGTNTLVGQDPVRIRTVFEQSLTPGGKAGRIPPLWDGHAAERIAALIKTWLGRSSVSDARV